MKQRMEGKNWFVITIGPYTNSQPHHQRLTNPELIATTDINGKQSNTNIFTIIFQRQLIISEWTRKYRPETLKHTIIAKLPCQTHHYIYCIYIQDRTYRNTLGIYTQVQTYRNTVCKLCIYNIHPGPNTIINK